VRHDAITVPRAYEEAEPALRDRSEMCAPLADEVHMGANAQASLLSELLGIDVVVDYMAPSCAGVDEQNSALESAAATQPDGIAVDPVADSMTWRRFARYEIGACRSFCSTRRRRSRECRVSATTRSAGTIAAERLVGLIGGRGKVAVMRGFRRRRTTGSATRRNCLLKRHPGMSIVDGRQRQRRHRDAEREAAAVLGANPDLRGYLCCDAAAPIGIAAAVRKAGKVGAVSVVGMDGSGRFSRP